MVRLLAVVGLDEAFHTFTPRFGMGVVTVEAGGADPVAALDLAERKSWQNATNQPPTATTTY